MRSSALDDQADNVGSRGSLAAQTSEHIPDHVGFDTTTIESVKTYMLDLKDLHT